MVGNGNATLERWGSQSCMSMLLVEDNLAEARFLAEALKGTVLSRCHLAHVKRLGEALEQLRTDHFDVVLLDLTLPDSQGLASLDSVVQQSPSLPIVVLTNTNDDELAMAAVRRGAQDYLVKRQVNQEILVRSLRYAIERKQGAEALREANEILELRVQARTAELRTANELLRQEVEQRQKVQERLELAQKAGKIGTFEWHIPSNYITWSAELEALYGLASGSFEGCYEGWIQTLHPDDRPRLEMELHQAIQASTRLDTDFRILLPDQTVRWIAVKSSIFQDSTGNPMRMIGIHMDITETKQLEAQFLRTQRLESLGTLASGIAHDLNNILTPILAAVQLLPHKVSNLNESTQQLLKTLETSAQRGAGLVKQIVSFTRGVEGKRLCIQVSHLLLEIEKIIRQTLPKSIQIELDTSSNLWSVMGDATQLHQVFMNLCVNARDAMPQGGTLQISAENKLIDDQYSRMHLNATVGPHVVITVADTGMGIAPGILHRIFDPFFTTKDVGQGTGLGLAAVLGIIKSHGGFIDVQSEVGKGTQFRVFLPATPAPPAVEEVEMNLLLGNQELVLVVDDEVAICEIVKTTLEAYNYQVLTAKDGIEAIALCAEHKETLQMVLIDLMMPMMEGLTVIPLLQRFNPDLFIVAMSGLNSIDMVSQAEKLNIRGFLPKPFTTQDLLQTLHRG